MRDISRVVIFATIVYLLSVLLYYVAQGTPIDSHFDFVFETNTLAIVLYIYFISNPTIKSNNKLKYGVWLLISTKIYDIVTEIKVLDELSDQYEFADSFIEDGLQQLAYVMIAIGLTELKRKAKELSMRDELTGLYNRKKLKDIPFSEFDLIYFDLDGLKEINDSEGHAAGDLILKRFAQSLVDAMNKKELGFRLGGDEFIVATVAGRSKQLLDALEQDLSDGPVKYSYGVESTRKEDLDAAIRRTDLAMYKMKSSQSNKVD
ncbi:GGDEF domain-containing protein [Vibrio amylolyticus]|uniref:GGDEF domain-containing protein n=1 Tax=Vibrio amylolyticus TaxID=2847292 RepID=UPI00354D915F